MKTVYFDNAATTKIKSEVLNEMLPYLSTNYGNASSLYKIGKDSKNAIEYARKQVASLINCDPNEIYFTSCGTESDNTALKGFAYSNKNKGNHIITSKIEHPAILETCKFLESQGFEVTYISVNSDGFLNLNELENSIRPTTILISIMFANNEIGTLPRRLLPGICRPFRRQPEKGIRPHRQGRPYRTRGADGAERTVVSSD